MLPVGEARSKESVASTKACNLVRQRDCTSPVRSLSPSRKCAIFSCTLALVPRQVLAVTSPRAQPQIASSALKSGLWEGKRITCKALSDVARYSRTAFPPCAGPLSQMTIRGSGWWARNCRRKAALVSDELVPVSSIYSTSPVSRQTAE